MSTLYVDIDSTIWPAEVEYSKAAEALFGKTMRMDWYAVSELEEEFGSDYGRIFSYALQPSRIEYRKMYPGVPQALFALHAYGFRIHFMSHNEHKYESVLAEWLYKELVFMPFDITVRSAGEMDKVDYMSYDPNTYGIVEDKASTLVDAADAGYMAYAKLQPWNLKVAERPDIIGFDDWADVPSIMVKERGYAHAANH